MESCCLMQYACTVCGTPSNERRCPRHRRAPNAPWSHNRNRAAQARFRRDVLRNAGSRCQYVNPDTHERCEEIDDLRAAHHPIPLRDYVTGDPAAYDPANGRAFCLEHDRATDPHAR